MRISDWSSDVCSSNLGAGAAQRDGSGRQGQRQRPVRTGRGQRRAVALRREAMMKFRKTLWLLAASSTMALPQMADAARPWMLPSEPMFAGSGHDRKSVVTGQRVYVRVEHGGPG